MNSAFTNKKRNVRVMIAGDVHGNRAQMIKDVAHALNKRADVLIVAGDFGVGFRLAKDTDGTVYDPWSEFVSDLAVSSNLQIAFIDGNHENFDYIETFGENTSPYQVATNVWHIPRGSVFDIAGATFAGMGGAISIDREFRDEGVTYWQQEAITVDDIERLWFNAYEKPIDVLITHDGPWTPVAEKFDYHTNISMPRHPGDKQYPPARELDDSIRNRSFITTLVQDLAPTYNVHGHMHMSYEYEFSVNTTVFGMGRDDGPIADHTLMFEINSGIVKVIKEEGRTNKADALLDEHLRNELLAG